MTKVRARLEMKRPFARLRGWGGVASMAVACLLAACLVLLPVKGAADQHAEQGGQGVAHAVQAKAEKCDDKEPDRSLPKSTDDGDTIKAIKARGDNAKLVIGVDQNSYRWGYRDPDDGQLHGFDIDLAKEIGRSIMGREDAVTFRAVPTNQRIPMLKSGKVDLIVRTMTISCTRKAEGVEFSTAYFKTGQQVLAPEDSTIEGYDDTLNGRRVCVADGSTADEALKKESHGAKILRVVNQLDCLVQLQLGNADAVVTDSALGAGQAAQDPTVELKGEPFTEEYYGVAAKQGADDLVGRVNDILEKYRDGGDGSKWQKAYGTWLEADMGDSPGPPPARYQKD
ncbi:glutamate ABC transporter substrate-binding protein [Streptomyces sp. T-3]|nr:glutamate ABC transporter substrate-binding protein [Streptomyces sp. T-3]